MTSMSVYSPTLLTIITFLVTLVQRAFAYQLQRILNFFRSFAHNWLELPLKTQEQLYFSSTAYLPGSSESKSVAISLSHDRSMTGFLPYRNITWRKKDAKIMAETRPSSSILEKSESRLWSKIKEMSHKTIEEPENFEEDMDAELNLEVNNRHFLSNTMLKLEDYDRINMEYLDKKYNGGMEEDGYSFTHPLAKSVYFRNIASPGAYLRKSWNIRALKRKAPSFKPTELSTIFENLAY